MDDVLEFCDQRNMGEPFKQNLTHAFTENYKYYRRYRYNQVILYIYRYNQVLFLLLSHFLIQSP